MADSSQQNFLRGTKPAGQQFGPLTVQGAEANNGVVPTAGDNRYAGAKTPYCATVTAAGDTTLITPATGNHLEVYWISGINDPDEATTPLVKFILGSTELYRVYAIAHWERFVGAANEALKANLSGAASVAVTVHYKELS